MSWNDCFRKIFKFCTILNLLSTREVQYFCNEMPFSFIYDLVRWKFLTAILMSESVVFLRSFVSDKKRLLDKFMSKYGENVSIGSCNASKHMATFSFIAN